MRRVLSLWFPTFASDLVKRRLARGSAGADRPVLLTREVAGRELIASCCARSLDAGVRTGMDLAHARSLMPAGASPHIEPHRPDRQQEALVALSKRLLRLSPLVQPDPPDGVLIDFTGTEFVHRGETRIIRSAARGLRKLGVHARLGIASTFACAWGLARFAPRSPAVAREGEEKAALAPLPVAALHLDEATTFAFREVGITRVEHLLALRRSSLVARFGPEILERLDKAFGIIPERLTPIDPPAPLHASLLFEGPSDQWASLEAAARQVLTELVSHLATRERGVRSLLIELPRPDAKPEMRTVTLSRASRNEKHLWSLVRSQLERVDLSKGVEGVVLRARRTARLRHEQLASPALGGSAEQAAQAAWGELIDTLIDRLGADNVVRIEAVESHLPEHAHRERSVLEQPGSRATVTAADRPARLFPQPEPAEAMALVPDGPVLSLTWRRRRWRVVACAGPERLSAEWWRWPDQGRQAVPPDRDYYALQLETGLWVWACRQLKTRRWFVHGEWC